MGNAHVLSQRIGSRPDENSEEVSWATPIGGTYVFDNSQAGVAPGQLVAEVTIDKTIKLEGVVFQWICEDSPAAPKNTEIAVVKAPLTMSTLKTNCSLPRPWPPGSYRVEFIVGVDQPPVCVIPFKICSKPDKIEACQMYFQRTPDSKRQEFFDVFAPDAGELYVVFETSYSCNVREKSFITWTAKEAPLLGPPDFELLCVPIDPCVANTFKGDVAIKTPWPVGTYEVSLTLNNEVLFRKELQCVDDHVTFEGKLMSLKDGKPLDVLRVAPNVGELACSFLASAVCNITDNVIVRWVFVSEPRTMIAKVILESGKYDQVNSECGMPPGKPWPTGDYVVELLMDGRLMETLQFKITNED